MKRKVPYLYFLIMGLLFSQTVEAQLEEGMQGKENNRNLPEREEWLQDAGFGLFIHFSFDSQLGTVISHSMVGASDDYLERFINELPKSFNPRLFSAEEIVSLAKLAGIQYIVLTTKHHSGFCLWDTETTDFKITNTPYGKDLVAEYVTAVREQGLGVGFYFSPEDFHFLHKEKQLIRRSPPEDLPQDVMERYLDYTAKQCTELMSRYGKIDVLFFDGGERLQEKAKNVSWDLQPEVLVTRGALPTPEQNVPGLASETPWEACITMGTQWQYKPTKNNFKSPERLIELLIESRAKGGTLLLNVGPKPNGLLREEEEDHLREIAAWNFINQEAVKDVRPWIITNEKNIWFTKHKSENTVYAYVTQQHLWPRGERREFVLKSVKTTDKSSVSILGQSDKVVEYQPSKDPKTRFEQKEDGLHISCVRAHRIFNNHLWPHPIVLKITHAEAALKPPFVQTIAASQDGKKVLLKGSVLDKGDADKVEVGFLYRPYAGFVESVYGSEWEKTPLETITDSGNAFEFTLENLTEGTEYEFRAILHHPKIDVLGDVMRFRK